MSTPTTETPETLRARADAEAEAASMTANTPRGSELRTMHRQREAELRARGDDLESAGKAAAHTPGPLAVLCSSVGDYIIAECRPRAYVASKMSGESDLRLLAAAYTSYDHVCGPRAIEAAESDLLADALAALRCLLAGYANVAGAHAEYGDFEEWAAVKNARAVLARAPGGRPK